MNDPVPLVVQESGSVEDAPGGAVPIALYGVGGTGVDADTGVGREVLNIEGSTDLATIPDFAKYSYVDIRGERTNQYVTINLPKASDYGHGRILYINDKLGNIDPNTWQTRVTLRTASGEGIDGFAIRSLSEKNGYIALRATNPGTVALREWQVVGENSPVHHTNTAASNWWSTPVEIGKGHVTTFSGAHVYVPLKHELHPSYRANKYWIRHYPTEAMANLDINRAPGEPVPAGVQVMNEFTLGGDLPYTSYGTGAVVSSWENNGKPRNTYIVICTQLTGTPGTLSVDSTYKDMAKMTY